MLPDDDSATDRALRLGHVAVRHLSEHGAEMAGEDRRLSIEVGGRFYAMQIEWIDWAAGQVAAGTLVPGGALPALAQS